MKTANPYLTFAGNTEEAFTFYRSVFGGEFLGVLRFRDLGDNPMGVPEHELDRIAHIALPLAGGSVLMGTDVLEGWPPITLGNNVYTLLEAESAAEARRLYDGLSAGGRPEMPLEPTVWAELYGNCVDRFGIRWVVMYAGEVSLAAGPGA